MSRIFLGVTLAALWIVNPGLAMSQEKEEAVVKEGAEAPDFTMTGIDGKEFKLSERIKNEKRIVLMFSRAGW